MGGGLLGSLSGLWGFGLPLFFLGDAIALWLVWVLVVWQWPRLPPLFRATHRDRGWLQGPAMAVEEGLEQGRYAPAIDFARYRTARVLIRRYHVPPAPVRPEWLGGPRLAPEATALVRLHQTLDRAYRLAVMAESPAEDFLSRRRQPQWRAASLELFVSTLPELETLLPPLEVGL